MVGLGRFELPTSRLSGVRSNQLSYRPVCAWPIWLDFPIQKQPIGCPVHQDTWKRYEDGDALCLMTVFNNYHLGGKLLKTHP